MTPLDRRRTLILIAVSGAVLVAGCRKDQTPLEDPIAAPLADFSRRVDDYMVVRKQITDTLGDLDPNQDQNKIATRAVQLGQAIIAARSQAKQGDLFTPEIATVISTLITEEYSRRSEPIQDTREDQQDELPDFVPTVNQIYPTTYPLATFPASLLPLLPRLPEHVEYRIVQGYLILRDIEANVILDLMPRAVPTGG